MASQSEMMNIKNKEMSLRIEQAKQRIAAAEQAAAELERLALLKETEDALVLELEELERQAQELENKNKSTKALLKIPDLTESSSDVVPQETTNSNKQSYAKVTINTLDVIKKPDRKSWPEIQTEPDSDDEKNDDLSITSSVTSTETSPSVLNNPQYYRVIHKKKSSTTTSMLVPSSKYKKQVSFTDFCNNQTYEPALCTKNNCDGIYCNFIHLPKGYCKFGNDCRNRPQCKFKHDKTKRQTVICASCFNDTECEKDNCTFGHLSQSDIQKCKDNKMCLRYFSTGTCTYDVCNFRHYI